MATQERQPIGHTFYGRIPTTRDMLGAPSNIVGAPSKLVNGPFCPLIKI